MKISIYTYNFGLKVYYLYEPTVQKLLSVELNTYNYIYKVDVGHAKINIYIYI